MSSVLGFQRSAVETICTYTLASQNIISLIGSNSSKTHALGLRFGFLLLLRIGLELQIPIHAVYMLESTVLDDHNHFLDFVIVSLSRDFLSHLGF